MATFYPSSTNQRDAAPNSYMRDPVQSTYPDSSGNMMYLNFSSSGPFSEMLASASEPQPNCTTEFPVISQESSLNEHAYNAWNDENAIARGSVILNGQTLSLHQSNFSQGLSLSLGTQIPMTSFKFQESNPDISMLGPRDGDSSNKLLHMNASAYGLGNLVGGVSSSKYLKAAQNLLDEVVNVQKALKNKANKGQNVNRDNDGASKSEGAPSNPQELTANSSSELSPSERHDLQNKITKLLAMLDEVDRRYKQYYHQMQVIVSSFDSIAGRGAAKPYTALALQTISRHFRCLRDAISGQIRSTRKILGEQESASTKGCGISRLRYIDQHLRQQRAMQQLGMMQPHAWRPQRGLPETSVSALRAWLFEHFLHPYPNDSEKLMLARQTGLTRGQVSNWFINARVRLWKPMVEEMYKEEFGESEMDSISSSENAAKARGDEPRSSEDRGEDLLQSPGSDRCPTSTGQTQFTDPSKQSNLMQFASFQNETMMAEDAYRALKMQEAIAQSQNTGRFPPYQMATDMESYRNVSLTLGLQHCDDASLAAAAAADGQQGFLAVRGEDIYGQQGFGPSHLLHDFVA